MSDEVPGMVSLPSIHEMFPGLFSEQSVLATDGTTARPNGDQDNNTANASKNKHACKICYKRFSRPSTLQNHFRSHTGEKPFFCTHAGCGRSFSAKSNMMRHARQHRGPPKPAVADKDVLPASSSSASRSDTGTAVQEDSGLPSSTRNSPRIAEIAQPSPGDLKPRATR